MDEHLGLRLPAPNGHEQGLQNEVRCLAALHGPAHNPPGVQVNDDSQIGKAFVGFDVCDVSDPCRVRCSDVELAIQGVVNDD